jgi:hypothetical protein
MQLILYFLDLLCCCLFILYYLLDLLLDLLTYWAKRQQSLKKDRNRSFSRFDTNLVKREKTVTERERGEKGALKNANLG